MGLHVILFAIGLALLLFGVPLTALVTGGILVAITKNADNGPVGFIGGYVLGILIAAGGLILAIFQAFAIAHLIWG